MTLFSVKPPAIGPEVYRGLESQLKRGLTGALRQATAELKTALKEDTASALGTRTANTWKATVYPQSGASLEPAGYVKTKAPGIIEAYSVGVTIRPRRRNLLWIPTEDVPMMRSGRRMTPEEVEARFGRNLIFIAANDRGFHTASIRRNAVGYLVMKGLVIRKASGRWRSASARELERGRQGTKAISSVIMFSGVKKVQVQKRLHLVETANRIAATVPSLIEQELARSS